MKTKIVKYPCRGCVYFNTCGDGARTEFCAGRMTKSEQKPKNGEPNPDYIFLEWNADKTDFTIWNAERIKNAFNFGNGTMKDFYRYMRDNKNVCFDRISKSNPNDKRRMIGNEWWLMYE